MFWKNISQMCSNPDVVCKIYTSVQVASATTSIRTVMMRTFWRHLRLVRAEGHCCNHKIRVTNEQPSLLFQTSTHVVTATVNRSRDPVRSYIALVIFLIHKPCSCPVSSPVHSPGQLIELLQQDVAFIIILCKPVQNHGIKNRNVTSLQYPCCNIGTSIFILDNNGEYLING